MSVGLVAQAAVGVERRLGHAGRARGEEGDGDGRSPRAAIDPASTAAARCEELGHGLRRRDVVAGHLGPGELGGRQIGRRTRRAPARPGRARPRPRPPEAVMEGGGHRPETPARPVEQQRGGTVRELPGHHVDPRRDPAARSRPASVATPASTPVAVEPGDAVVHDGSRSGRAAVETNVVSSGPRSQGPPGRR